MTISVTCGRKYYTKVQTVKMFDYAEWTFVICDEGKTITGKASIATEDEHKAMERIKFYYKSGHFDE